MDSYDERIAEREMDMKCKCGNKLQSAGQEGVCRECFDRSPDSACSMAILENTTVNIFRTERLGSEGRYGIWVMTRSSGNRGAFFHGDEKAVHPPKWTVEQLSESSIGKEPGSQFIISCEKVDAKFAYETLNNWPEAQKQLLEICGRHHRP